MEFGNRSKVTVIYIVLALVLFFTIQSMMTTHKRRVPYSTFKTYLAEGRVEEVEVSETMVFGRLREQGGQPVEVFETVRIDEPDLMQTLEEKNVKSTGVVSEGGMKSVLLAWILPIGVILLIWGLIMKRMGKTAQGGVLAFGKSRTKIIGEKEVQVSFSDVAGVDEARVELEEIVHFLKEPDRYTEIGARIPKGVLLVGPPGTGKTLLARAVAGEANVPFFLMSGSDFVEMFVGVGASRVRDLFQQAQEKAPCIIFIDELDALGKARGSGPAMGGHDEREQTLNQLLVEMDGFDPNKGVVIMAATNRPEILDPALLRPGRFDRQVLVDRPDLKGREAILGIHAKNVKLEKEVELNTVALRTPGFAGADLANVINEAALLAVRRDKTQVSMAEFEEAIDRVVAGLQKKGRLISPKERHIVAYHEVGHAVVGEVLPHAEKTHKISIVPRGMAALGMTWQRPTEDRFLLTQSELRDRIAALLGGRAAEEIFIGDVTTGAQNDLARATDIARAMVRQYGMSKELGPLAYDPESKAILPTSELMPSCDHGSTVGDKIDVEVQNVLEEAMRRAHQTLIEHREKIEQITSRLLEKEQLDGNELRELLAAT